MNSRDPGVSGDEVATAAAHADGDISDGVPGSLYVLVTTICSGTAVTRAEADAGHSCPCLVPTCLATWLQGWGGCWAKESNLPIRGSHGWKLAHVYK